MQYSSLERYTTTFKRCTLKLLETVIDIQKWYKYFTEFHEALQLFYKSVRIIQVLYGFQQATTSFLQITSSEYA